MAYRRSINTSASEDRLERLIEERMKPGADKGNFISLNFGFGSVGTNGFNFLFDGNNKWYEDLGFFFGGLTNVSDAVALGFGKNAIANADEYEGDSIGGKMSHSAITDESLKDTIVSIGPDYTQPLKGTGYFRNYGSKNDWGTHSLESGTWHVPINNVNRKILENYGKNIAKTWNIYNKSCVNHATNALWLAGVPTIPINFHPYILNTQLAVRYIGIHSSVHLTAGKYEN